MKKVFTAIAISMSALIATTAMAAPQQYQDHRDNRYQPTKPTSHWNHKQQDQRHDRFDRNNHNKVSVNPSREWRTGQTLPRQYSNSRFEADRDQVKRLPKTGRNQQWYKIGGDYVLVNERNDRIVKIIG